MYLSIVIPVYNEEKSLKPLYERIKGVCGVLDKEYEIIFIDDGSRDKSFDILEEIAQGDKNVKLIKFKKNFGQTAALSAGFERAKGEIIIPIDADLQNDPRDIPKLLAKLDEGFDVVSGWRKDRKDDFFSKKFPSQIANSLISFITKIKLHDYGCTLKAYRSEVLRGVNIYGEMHRFLPAYAARQGAAIAEIPVNHFPRKFGKTNYGVSKTFKVILDLLVIKFMLGYSTKPIYFFGGFGAISMFLGFTSGLLALYLKIFRSVSFILTPLPIITALFVLAGIQLIMMGIISDLVLRSNYDLSGKKTYVISKKVNFNELSQKIDD